VNPPDFFIGGTGHTIRVDERTDAGAMEFDPIRHSKGRAGSKLAPVTVKITPFSKEVLLGSIPKIETSGKIVNRTLLLKISLFESSIITQTVSWLRGSMMHDIADDDKKDEIIDRRMFKFSSVQQTNLGEKSRPKKKKKNPFGLRVATDGKRLKITGILTYKKENLDELTKKSEIISRLTSPRKIAGELHSA
jgi:hypothetical protein